MNRTQSRTGRRRFLTATLALPLVTIGPVSGQTLPLTPACGEKPERAGDSEHCGAGLPRTVGQVGS